MVVEPLIYRFPSVTIKLYDFDHLQCFQLPIYDYDTCPQSLQFDNFPKLPLDIVFDEASGNNCQKLLLDNFLLELLRNNY